MWILWFPAARQMQILFLCTVRIFEWPPAWFKQGKNWNMDKRKIFISPVTRIEGHANITIEMDDNGNEAMHCFM